MYSFWDFAYLTGLTPWDRDEPPQELVEYVEKGVIRLCRALDIGCGTGTSTIYLAMKGFEAHGLDVSSVAISRARRKARSKNVLCTFHNIDFTDTEKVRVLGIFDLAIDVGCYHSMPSPTDRAKYLQSLNAILRKDGTYLLWGFKRGNRCSFGPPGIEEREIESVFGGSYDVLEKRLVDTSFRPLFSITCGG